MAQQNRVFKTDRLPANRRSTAASLDSNDVVRGVRVAVRTLLAATRRAIDSSHVRADERAANWRKPDIVAQVRLLRQVIDLARIT